MNSHGREEPQSALGHGKHLSVSRCFVPDKEEFLSELPYQQKVQDGDAKVGALIRHVEVEESDVELSRDTTETHDLKRDSNFSRKESCDSMSSSDEVEHPAFENSALQCHHGEKAAGISDSLIQWAGACNTEGKEEEEEEDAVTPQIYRTNSVDAKNASILDPVTNIENVCGTMSYQSLAYVKNKGELDLMDHKEEKYFHYDMPLYEETGVWIPVSIPPMTEKEQKEWTSGFCSNGGYVPEEKMGWNQCIGEKELTMWDVVVDMLFVARGKLNAFASGDIGQISWVSNPLIEQAWEEMAQTLTEANFIKTQEVLESEPPKWLPDSSASSCMLCSVRFTPIMCPRHHCRFCGGIFCGDCTKGKSLLPRKFCNGNPQRVCDVCSVRLESVQPYLVDQVSRAALLPTHDLTDLSTLRSWVNFPWGQSMEYEIYKATNTIRGYVKVVSLRPEKRIPEAILRNAKGLAIITVVKVGMMVTYNVGTGLVVARREDGTWSPPSAISSFGMGWGAQAGGELTDFIIVLRTHDAVKTFCSDAHFSVGAGLSAAVGTIGRTAEAGVRAGDSGFAACYTYSCSKGAFVGCSLEGSMVTTRVRENTRFYGSQSISASGILLGSLPHPPAATALYRALAELYLQLGK